MPSDFFMRDASPRSRRVLRHIQYNPSVNNGPYHMAFFARKILFPKFYIVKTARLCLRFTYIGKEARTITTISINISEDLSTR